ncbi:MAG: hypothetical protein KY460_00125 [Actinobacteria bacterium]|nr:hypothetical protein [Actinomycetota bacterium]
MSDGPANDDMIRDTAEAEVLQALRRMFDVVDPPPAHVIAHARDAFAWHGIDAELAELVYDSAVAATPAGVRGDEDARQMTFRAPGLEIEVEVVSERTRIVIGQLVPAQTASIELRQGGRTLRAEADALGRFSFDGIAPGAIKLTVVTESGTLVQTEGLTI